MAGTGLSTAVVDSSQVTHMVQAGYWNGLPAGLMLACRSGLWSHSSVGSQMHTHDVAIIEDIVIQDSLSVLSPHLHLSVHKEQRLHILLYY